MADDNQTGLTGLLQGLRNIDPDKQKGVKKGVIVDKDQGSKSIRINPALNSQEKKRYENIFTIFKNIVFPGDEAKRASSGSKQSQIGSVTNNIGSKSGKSIGSGLGMEALIAGTLLAGLVTFWDEIKTGIQDFFGETLPNAGVLVGKGLAAGGKILIKMAGKIFPRLAGLTGKAFLKAARLIPFVGAAASFALAYMSFEDNDLIGMGLNLISGIVNLIPGVGNAASIILDGFIIMREFQRSDMTDEQKLEEKEGLIKKMKGWIKNSLVDKFRYLPIIGGMIRMGEGYLKMASGDVSGGLKDLFISTFSFMGGDGFGKAAEAGLDITLGMIKDKPDPENKYQVTGSVFKELRNRLKDKVITFLTELAGKIGGAVSETFVMAKYATFGALTDGLGAVSNMFGNAASGVGNLLGFGNSAQDAIVSGGKVTRLDNADQAIALKAGGAIDRMLKDRSGSVSVDEIELFSEMKEVGKQQLKNLIEMNTKLSQIVSNTAKPSTEGDVSFFTNPFLSEYV